MTSTVFLALSHALLILPPGHRQETHAKPAHETTIEFSAMVKLVLTAFGKFHGVTNNPTKDILQQIQSVRNFQNSVYKDIIYTALVEVSAEGASEHLRRIRKSIQNKYPTEKIVFIHMGVHGTASMIHL